MNCVLETAAAIYLHVRGRIMTEPVEEEVFTAQDSLEACKRKMEFKEAELIEEVANIGQKALDLKKKGDSNAAKLKIRDRRRALARLDRVRSSIVLLTSQIEAIKMSELDKVMVATIKQSTAAMKRAGINGTIQDAETVMNELEDHIREIHDMNAVLGAPIAVDEEEDALEEELGWLEETCLLSNEYPHKTVQVTNSMTLPAKPDASIQEKIVEEEEQQEEEVGAQA